MAIEIDELGTALSDIVSGYTDEIQEKVEAELDSTADRIIDYVKDNCPRSDSMGEHLADQFVKTEVGEGYKKTIYISAKKKSGLVHLIELGFKHRSGRHVAARPFLRPAYDELTPKMMDDIKAIIGGKA